MTIETRARCKNGRIVERVSVEKRKSGYYIYGVYYENGRRRKCYIGPADPELVITSMPTAYLANHVGWDKALREAFSALAEKMKGFNTALAINLADVLMDAILELYKVNGNVMQVVTSRLGSVCGQQPQPQQQQQAAAPASNVRLAAAPQDLGRARNLRAVLDALWDDVVRGLAGRFGMSVKVGSSNGETTAYIEVEAPLILRITARERGRYSYYYDAIVSVGGHELRAEGMAPRMAILFIYDRLSRLAREGAALLQVAGHESLSYINDELLVAVARNLDAVNAFLNSLRDLVSSAAKKRTIGEELDMILNRIEGRLLALEVGSEEASQQPQS